MNTSNNEMNIFERAVRLKLRFPSVRGLLTVEDVFDPNLPLTSRDAFNLDTIAKTVNASLKAAGEESFVVTSTNPEKPLLELRMEILKYVIDVRLAENEARKARTERQAKRAKLLDALASKEEAAIQNMDVAEIRKQLDELDAE